MDIIWLEILVAMIGEQFGDDMNNICGLVCNVRNKGSKVGDIIVVFPMLTFQISVWTKDWKDDDSNMRIGYVNIQLFLSVDRNYVYNILFVDSF